ncbi:hypothetical protein AGMMS49975_10460 [Clostridia bacterium]|nr:hypothetical protein AGMMS49975_10460 [Clostridia bacterium]
MATIHLNTFIGGKIAKPSINTKYGDVVLYSRVDGGIDRFTGSQGEADEIKNRAGVCNSPDNLRRLFVTSEFVMTEYHKAVRKKAVHFYEFGEEITADNPTRRSIFEGGGFYADIPREIPKLVSNGLKILATPWVYQNIEEVYFDWLPLMAEPDRPLVKPLTRNTVKSLSVSDIDWFIGTLFNLPISNACDCLKKQFPRLHTICFVERLEGVLRASATYNGKSIDHWLLYALRLKKEGLARSVNVWEDGNAGIVALYSPYKDSDKWKQHCSVKDGIYVFDRDVLKAYFERLQADYEKTETEEKPEPPPENEDTDEFDPDDGDWEFEGDFGDGDNADEPPDLTDAEQQDINDILKKYELLFKPVFFCEIPKGVLATEGLRAIKPHPRYAGSRDQIRDKAIFAEIQSVLREVGYGLKPCDKELRAVDNSDLAKNYLPEHILAYASKTAGGTGYSVWNDWNVAVTEEITSKYLGLFSASRDRGGFAAKFNALVTNAVLVTYCDANVMKLRVCLPSEYVDEFVKKLADVKFDNQNELAISLLGNGVMGVTVFYNLKEALETPSFAYHAIDKLLENGAALGLDNVFLGELNSGQFITKDFTENLRFSALIAAGSGSGKGVLTLNILAAAVGSGCPIFYADYKPEMSSMLWECEQRTGLSVFAYDGVLGNKSSLFPKYSIKNTLSEELWDRLKGTSLNILLYLKFLHLMAAICQSRATGGFDSSERVVFIVDELQKAANAAALLLRRLKPLTVKEKKTPSGEALDKEITLLRQWIASIRDGMLAYGITNGRMANANAFFLFQYIQRGEWDKYEKGAADNPCTVPPTYGTTVRILGRGTEKTPEGTLNLRNEFDKTKIADHRHFAYQDGKGNFEVFKPYIVLNSADPNSKSIEGLTNGNHDKLQKLLDDEGDGTTLNPEMSFFGLCEKITGGHTGDILHKAVTLAENYLKQQGVLQNYRDINEYMHDFSSRALFSVDDLASGAAAGYYDGGETYNQEDYGEDSDDSGNNFFENEYTNPYTEPVSEERKTTYGEEETNKSSKRGNAKPRQTPLDRDNAIECGEYADTVLSPFEEFLTNTPFRAGLYREKLFGAVLKAVRSAGIKRGAISRIDIINSEIFVNGRLLNLDGILGGDANIEFLDILSFKQLFKEYAALKTLTVDETAYECAVTEFNLRLDTDIFGHSKSIQTLRIEDSDGLFEIKRSDISRDKAPQKDKTNNARAKSDYALAFAPAAIRSIRSAWKKSSKGQKVWFSAAAKRAYDYAGENLISKGKFKPVKPLLAFTVGTAIGALGLGLWLGKNIIQMPFHIMAEKSER